ncbi:MAG: EAL domain-containing protein [Lachnospiraceae bacterium]|nr:EAL domain-containing protein [Lachnospiraceae bacterium]
MVCNDVFASYVKLLSENENSFSLMNRILELFWDIYHIARVEIDFSLSDATITPNGKDTKQVFSVKEQIAKEQPDVVRRFTTIEQGVVTFSLYGAYGNAEWNEQQHKELDVILEVLFMHSGRFRLMNIVKQSVMTDAMTSLPNSHGYLSFLKEVHHNQQLADYDSYYFNLKRFGLMNKKFGKREADSIISRYASALREFIEDGECVARLGGDNFAALIKKERSKEFIALLSGVNTYGMLGDEKIPVVISATAGVCAIDDSVTHYEQVLSEASVAMNVAKNVTKEPLVYVTKELNERILNEKKVIAGFSEALERKEFKVYYQPKVETDGYSLVGAEALVRWQQDGRIVSPAEFVPVIERDGLICRLDFYVLEQVCQDIKGWMEEGVEPVRVSVNFSRRHLSNPNFAENIMDTMKRYGVDSRHIEVELTETTDEEEQGLLAAFVHKMQQYQVPVAIDDFGTGYSSLNLLRSVPVEVLKIDKSFVDGRSTTENDSVVLSNIIRMAKQLNMDVITEGVERWEQVEFLHDMECNVVQGFLFDKPLPKDIFDKRVRAKKYDITEVVDYEG